MICAFTLMSTSNTAPSPTKWPGTRHEHPPPLQSNLGPVMYTPCKQNDWQMPMKTLPSGKLLLRAVKISTSSSVSVRFSFRWKWLLARPFFVPFNNGFSGLLVKTFLVSVTFFWMLFYSYKVCEVSLCCWRILRPFHSKCTFKVY